VALPVAIPGLVDRPDRRPILRPQASDLHGASSARQMIYHRRS
jgi:hypothetical protein